MRPFLRSLLAPMLLLACVSSATAGAIFDDPMVPTESGGEYFVGHASQSTFSYNARKNLLTYESTTYVVDPSGMVGTRGTFDWSAKVDSDGHLLGKGEAEIYWDFGSGLQRVLTGRVVEVGSWFGTYICFTGLARACIWDTPAISVDVTYQDPALAALLGIPMSGSMQWAGYFELFTPVLALTQSFTCSRPGDSRCSSYSHDVFVFYVSEPEAPVLLVTSLAAFVIAGRRRRLGATKK